LAARLHELDRRLDEFVARAQECEATELCCEWTAFEREPLRYLELEEAEIVPGFALHDAASALVARWRISATGSCDRLAKENRVMAPATNKAALSMIRKNPKVRATQVHNGSATPRELANATQAADIVTVPKRRCLAIDGAGSPKEPAFEQAIGALYGTAYTLKFARKKAGKSDFKVAPLEGRWWADTASESSGRPAPEQWRWRLRDPSRTRPEALETVLLRELVR
jgi:hypothetical protein